MILPCVWGGVKAIQPLESLLHITPNTNQTGGRVRHSSLVFVLTKFDNFTTFEHGFHRQPEALHFLDQNLEGGRDAGIFNRLTLDVDS